MRHAITILAALLIALAGAQDLFAHAKLLSSKPAAGEALTAGPDLIELQFSTRVQQKMSSIALIGPAGRPIALPPIVFSEDEKTLRASLPELVSGSYTVSWRALSADDHLISGEFTFQVGETPEAGPISEPAASEPDHGSMDHGEEAEEIVGWPQSIVRWFLYFSMMVVGGGLICRRFILQAIALNGNGSSGSNRLIKALFIGASAVLVVSLVVSLGLQTYSIFDAVGSRQAYRVLSETDFGFPWLIQFSGAVVVLVLTVLHPTDGDKGGPLRTWVVLAAWLVIPLAGSLTGHAKAAATEFSFATVSAWLHMIAAAVWIGGIVLFAVLLPGLISGFPVKARFSQLALAIQKFNRLAIASVVLLLLTGIYNTWIHVESFSALLNSLYGRVLMGKIAITVIMVGLGALNSFVLRPRMLAEGGQAAETSNEKFFFRSVRTEAALAAIVLLLAAILAFLPPAREHSPPAGPAAAKIRETVRDRDG